MQNKKITAQDIADKLNISRNTVSKALNNTGNISEDTKMKVIQTAFEMGYKKFCQENKNITFKNKEIALFTTNMPNSSHFGSKFLSGFEKKISSLGIKLSIYIIREDDLLSRKLPSNFQTELIDAIICIEMFDANYSNFICKLGIPTLFIDCPTTKECPNLESDILLMENYNSVYTVTKNLINNGCKNISFVGDPNHCQSFYERWQGYCSALLDYNIQLDKSTCILDNDSNPYSDSSWLRDNIKKLDKLPDAFICANDFIAVSLVNALKSINISIPEDTLVCGFDGSLEAKIIVSQLTTITIPSYDMGNLAAELIISRIKDNSTPFKTVHVKTSIDYRESTGFNIINTL